jgi:N-acetylmuramoyl-L-alanine amidase
MIHRYSVIALIVFITACFSCSRTPYSATNRSYKKQAKAHAKTIRQQPAMFTTDYGNPPYWVGTTNFNLRKPNYVIIHHTAQNSCQQTLQTFTLPRTQVSAHYVICKDGTIHHMLNDYLRAWQAGVSKWGNNTDINSCSVGIEIDNNGFETFTEPQINSLMQLLDTLKHKYAIPTANFIGHADIAPTRKNDPNVTFPWKRLADKGFGLWYDTTTDSLPGNFNSLQALKIVGYDVKDSTAAITTFKRKFLQQDKSTTLTDDDKRVLYSLMKKSM